MRSEFHLRSINDNYAVGNERSFFIKRMDSSSNGGAGLAFAGYMERDELESGERIGKGSDVNETVVVAEPRNAEYSIFFCEYTFAQ